MKLLRDFLLVLALVAVSTSGGSALGAAALPGYACPRASAALDASASAPRTARSVQAQAIARASIRATGAAADSTVQHACHVPGTLTLGAAPIPLALVVPKGHGSLCPSAVRRLVASRVDTLYRPPRA